MADPEATTPQQQPTTEPADEAAGVGLPLSPMQIVGVMMAAMATDCACKPCQTLRLAGAGVADKLLAGAGGDSS